MMDADVAIVGAGAGGSACAWSLARQGVRVVVLESGPAYDPAADFRLDLPDWERRGFPEKPGSALPYSFAPMQPLEPRRDGLRSWNHKLGRPVQGERRVGYRYHHVAGVGGSTLHFTGEAHRLHPGSMAHRSRFGMGADWPLGYDELEPHYVAAERLVGVAGQDDPVRRRSAPYPLPPHPPSFASGKLAEACRRLGLEWTPNPVAVLSQPYDGRPECNYCGNCQRGCPRRDKGSADVTFVARALAGGRCEVHAGCHVLRLEPGRDDRVAAVEWVDASGVRRKLRPRVVVVACGAVQTPRLLLSSAGPRAPGGLGNESGQAGRNLLETLSWQSSALHPEPLGSHRGLPSGGICWDYNAPDSIPGVVGGCRFHMGVAESDFLGPINYARRVVKGWGRAHREAMRSAFGRVLSVGSIGEFLPNDGTYVDLDPQQRDRHGIPLPRIHSRLDPMDIARLEFMARRCRDILAAAGAEAPFEENGTYDVFSSTHVFGTCRMGSDPNDSVVNRNCRSHRWRNLFVVDASVFPSTGGGESPALTIEALAIRAGEHIRSLLARREV